MAKKTRNRRRKDFAYFNLAVYNPNSKTLTRDELDLVLHCLQKDMPCSVRNRLIEKIRSWINEIEIAEMRLGRGGYAD